MQFTRDLDFYKNVVLVYTRSELASLAHSFYTCMELRINLLK